MPLNSETSWSSWGLLADEARSRQRPCADARPFRVNTTSQAAGRWRSCVRGGRPRTNSESERPRHAGQRAIRCPPQHKRYHTACHVHILWLAVKLPAQERRFGNCIRRGASTRRACAGRMPISIYLRIANLHRLCLLSGGGTLTHPDRGRMAGDPAAIAC